MGASSKSGRGGFFCSWRTRLRLCLRLLGFLLLRRRVLRQGFRDLLLGDRPVVQEIGEYLHSRGFWGWFRRGRGLFVIRGFTLLRLFALRGLCRFLALRGFLTLLRRRHERGFRFRERFLRDQRRILFREQLQRELRCFFLFLFQGERLRLLRRDRRRGGRRGFLGFLLQARHARFPGRDPILDRLRDDVADAPPGNCRGGTLRDDGVREPGHELVLDLSLHGVVEEPRVVQAVEDAPQ
mmetsp:Transcript_10544/g.38234  ORF Transcript_10544/g.38234 Transcript_10544/m.38234 type:complete len:239 (-) Transcript_10544:983-1699(-)